MTPLSSFYLTISILVGLSWASSACDHLSNATSSFSDLQAFLNQTFDIIIIGGGTAGLALAVRLAESQNINVGLLEAGVFHKGDPVIEVPGFAGQGAGNPIYDWNFVSLPQVSAGGRELPLTRGKMLGGSSGLNLMAWTRATTIEYSAWQNFANSSEWNWDALLNFFKKSEDITLTPGNPYPGISAQAEKEAADELASIAGFSGPITASYNELYPDVVPTVVETMNNLGLRTNAIPINGSSVGITNTRCSIDRRNGIRVYSPTGYLCPKTPLGNLHILLGAQVTKINFAKAKDDFIATAVNFSLSNETYLVDATREVVLSAGTIQTPQILELSGIGNSTILATHGLESLVDLPGVGENFQEHLYVAVQWELQPGHTTFDLLRNSTFEAKQEAIYNSSRRGLLAATDTLSGYVPLDAIVSKDVITELLHSFDRDAANAESSSLESMQYPIQRTWMQDNNVPAVELVQWSRGITNVVANNAYVTILGGIMHPMSRGSSHIRSSAPSDSPNVDPRFLEKETDVLILLNTLKFILKIGTTYPFSDVIALQSSPDPSAISEAELIEYIRNTSAGGDHIIGTAAMAPRENHGVVDKNLRVYGTRNVRIVDASIIPIHIATHPQATCYAIAEKAASIILSDLRV